MLTLTHYNEDSVTLISPYDLAKKFTLQELIKVDENPRDLEPSIEHANIYGDYLYLTLEWTDGDCNVIDRTTEKIHVDSIGIDEQLIDAP